MRRRKRWKCRWKINVSSRTFSTNSISQSNSCVRVMNARSLDAPLFNHVEYLIVANNPPSKSAQNTHMADSCRAEMRLWLYEFGSDRRMWFIMRTTTNVPKINSFTAGTKMWFACVITSMNQQFAQFRRYPIAAHCVCVGVCDLYYQILNIYMEDFIHLSRPYWHILRSTEMLKFNKWYFSICVESWGAHYNTKHTNNIQYSSVVHTPNKNQRNKNVFGTFLYC